MKIINATSLLVLIEVEGERHSFTRGEVIEMLNALNAAGVKAALDKADRNYRVERIAG